MYKENGAVLHPETQPAKRKEVCTMKKFICAVLALVMVLSLAACGSKQDDNGGKTDVDLTAQEVLDKLKETLGDSYGCDAQDDEDRMTNYYGLDMSQLAQDEAAKVDDAWKDIFGSAGNKINAQ